MKRGEVLLLTPSVCSASSAKTKQRTKSGNNHSEEMLTKKSTRLRPNTSVSSRELLNCKMLYLHLSLFPGHKRPRTEIQSL